MDKKNMTSLAGYLGVGALLLSGLAAYLVPHLALIWQIALGVALVSLIAFIVLDRKSFQTSLSRKTTRYGINAIVMSVIMLFIVIFINVIANEYDLKKDVTKNKLNTLSDETLKVLKGLDSEITVKAFLQPTQIPMFDRIFEKYSYHTDKLKKEYVDLDKDPLAVTRYKVKSAGTLVFESPTRSARVENLQGADDPKMEEKVTNAIVQVAKGDKKKVYFLKGHGERSISDTGRDGYSQMRETLESGRYKVEELMLLDKDQIPSDADMLIIAGPKSDFTKHETDLLEKFFQAGGKGIVMLDPTSTPTVGSLLKTLGTTWSPNSTIYETNKLQQLAGGNPLAPIITSYDPRHEITKENRELSIFPVASPVEKAEKGPDNLRVQSLFKTSDRSLVANLKGNRLDVNEKTSRRGPISIAVAVTGTAGKDPAVADNTIAKEEPAAKKKETRVVVVGDSDFPANGVSRFGINSDIFQNMLSWVAHEEDLISVRPKDTSVSELEITDARLRVIHVASVFLLPILAVVAAIGISISRRRK